MRGSGSSGSFRQERGGPIVEALKVTKVYHIGNVTIEALREVSLTIHEGEFVAVVGPSGNGKSTLVNCLSGLDSIDSGTVIVDGLDVHALSERKRTAHRASRMGFVFQGFNLIPVLNAVENVELPLLAAGTRPRVARHRAWTMLDRLGIADRARHRPGELSGGQQQRVALGRALVADPSVVWADEPTGNLDSTTAATIVDLFCEIRDRGQTIVMVTHDTAALARVDRVIRIVDGRVHYGLDTGEVR